MYDLCRTCCKVVESSNRRNLFEEPDKLMINQIVALTGYALLDAPYLPTLICESCELRLRQASAFREVIIKSQELLQGCGNDGEIEELIDTKVEGLHIDTFDVSAHDIKVPEKESIDNQIDKLLTDCTAKGGTEILVNMIEKFISETYDPLGISHLVSPAESAGINPSSKTKNVSKPPPQAQYINNSIDCETGTITPIVGNGEEEDRFSNADDTLFFDAIMNESDSESEPDDGLPDLQFPPKPKRKRNRRRKGEPEIVKPVKPVYTAEEKAQRRKEYWKKRHELRKGWFMCEICGKFYDLKSTLQHHLKRHAGVKRHQCPHCPKRFYLPGYLRRHLGQKHREHVVFDQLYKCTYCSEEFIDVGRRVYHERKVHPEMYTEECKICGKMFQTRLNVRKHMVTHSSDRRHYCSVCDKYFHAKTNLKSHYETELHKASLAAKKHAIQDQEVEQESD